MSVPSALDLGMQRIVDKALKGVRAETEQEPKVDDAPTTSPISTNGRGLMSVADKVKEVCKDDFTSTFYFFF